MPGSDSHGLSETERRPADVDALDRALVERAQRGDQAAVGQLYQRHVDVVYAYIRVRVGDDSLAEDLTQDVFMSALRGLGKFKWDRGFFPWLMRIAHNRVVNHWRTRSRRPEEVEIEISPVTVPDALQVDDRGSRDLLLEVSDSELDGAMARLTDLQRDVIALRFGAGMSLLETANVMGRQPNAIKNLQHKALAALRRHLMLPEAGDA